MAPTEPSSISGGRKILYAAFTALAFLLALEAGAHLALALLGPGEAPLRVGFQAEKAEIFEADPELFWRLKPDLHVERGANPRMIDVRTNALALRGGEIAQPKPRGTTRILTLGDSCTFGSGARTDETYPARLGRLLGEARPRRRIEVINAGVPGYTSYQALRFLELRGVSLEPDVVIVATGFNDAAEAVSAGKRSFGNVEFLPDSAYAAALRPARRLALTRLIRRLRGTGPAAVAERGRDAGAKLRVSFAEYRSNLSRIVEICRARGILPVIVVWPVASQAGIEIHLAREPDVLANQRAAREVAERLAVGLVDLVPRLASRPELFLDEVHLTPAGYAEVARAIAEELENGPAGLGPG